jgi:hypothetical protein
MRISIVSDITAVSKELLEQSREMLAWKAREPSSLQAKMDMTPPIEDEEC